MKILNRLVLVTLFASSYTVAGFAADPITYAKDVAVSDVRYQAGKYFVKLTDEFGGIFSFPSCATNDPLQPEVIVNASDTEIPTDQDDVARMVNLILMAKVMRYQIRVVTQGCDPGYASQDYPKAIRLIVKGPIE